LDDLQGFFEEIRPKLQDFGMSREDFEELMNNAYGAQTMEEVAGMIQQMIMKDVMGGGYQD